MKNDKEIPYKALPPPNHLRKKVGVIVPFPLRSTRRVVTSPKNIIKLAIQHDFINVKITPTSINIRSNSEAKRYYEIVTSLKLKNLKMCCYDILFLN